jgi:hypothetical protein
MQPRKKRVSLTPKQLSAGAGAELLVLCETITTDGSVTEGEAEELKAWLDVNASTDLPSIQFLTEIVNRILADGRVTDEERRELHQALERVLPPAARQQAKQNRSATEAAATARNQHVYVANFLVAGIHFESRYQIISRHVAPQNVVFLVRDRGNAYSRNAVEVRLRTGQQIGYVPETYAPEIAPFLDAGHRHAAYVTKVLTGGRAPIPVIQAYIYRPDAEPGVLEEDVPAAMSGVGSGRAGTGVPLRSKQQMDTGASASAVGLGRGCGCMVSIAIVVLAAIVGLVTILA